MNKNKIYSNYRAKFFEDTGRYSGEGTWWVVGSLRDDTKGELKICSVPHWIAHQQSVALAIAAGLNSNTALALVDLI